MRRLKFTQFNEMNKDIFVHTVTEYLKEYFEDISECITVTDITLGNYFEMVERHKYTWDDSLPSFVSSSASATLNIKSLSCYYKTFGSSSEKNHQKFLKEMYLVFDFFRAPQTLFSIELNFLD